MSKGKFWVVAAAVAAMSFPGIVQASSRTSPADALTLSTPLHMQANAAQPARRPLMSGLDAIGVAQPLDDLRIDIGGHVAASTTFYLDASDAKLQPGRSFDLEDQDPTFNQFGMFIDRSVDQTRGEFDLGGRVEFIWGGDARFTKSTGLFDDDNVEVGPDEQFDLIQAYLDIALPVDGMKLRLGKFATPTGVETINPTTRPLYSPGLLFTYMLPFTHTGVVLSYQATEAWLFEGGLIRGWDEALEDENDSVSFLARAGYAFPDDRSNAALTLIYGPEFADDNTANRLLVDLVYTTRVGENWRFAGQGTFLWETDQNGPGPGEESGMALGLGGWASYVFSQFLTFNGRAEFLHDGDALRFGAFNPVLGVDPLTGDPVLVSSGSNNVYSLAFGVTVTPFPTDAIGSNLKLRPEVRVDFAQNEVFGPNNDNSEQVTFAIEGFFTF